VAGIPKIIAGLTAGLHSSGYCCGFKPHSLFIAIDNYCNTRENKDTTILNA
jgi:hypothetical protein